MRVFLFGITMWSCMLFLSGPIGFSIDAEAARSNDQAGFTGSTSCRECHEKFYKLWAPSHHGLAMRPYTDDFAEKKLTPQERAVPIGGFTYLAKTGPGQGFVLEKSPEGEKKYAIKEVLGGKNVFYFLTLMERGRLQTLPVAFDVRKGEWFDTTASGVRHVSDEPVHWRESAYTFNTSCYRCHVSQLQLNYDLRNDAYRTAWREPGINCETCHGGAEEHIRVCKEAPEGTVPEDLKTIRGGRGMWTAGQQNSNCAPCHAKMTPLTKSFTPGDLFFDHYDLNTLEDPDFHPDGRDLGENYTYTLWLMSPCVKKGDLDCLHCHTSSGRFRRKKNPNQACAPCHAERIENSVAHTHHPKDSEGDKCIACHMPMTEFARMRRSDHSMLPPTPSATIEFKSPNACNMCHTDQDAAWADKYVRQWRERDYQAPVLHRASLVQAARKRDWSKLPEMLEYITNPERDAVTAAGLIRLLRACEDRSVMPAVLKAMEDPSPLVRGAAAHSLQFYPSKETGEALVKAAGDKFRLVRVRAAASLAGFPKFMAQTLFGEKDLENWKKANSEYTGSILAQPDQWTSYYNYGNYHLTAGNLPTALDSYQTALKLEPRAVMALVNLSMAYAQMGDMEKAEKNLNKALEVEPGSAAANFNLGLLKAELRDPASSEKYLRAALKADPDMHQAAYNLSVLLSKKDMAEAVEWGGKAFEKSPNPKYGYTLAYFLRESGDRDPAVEILKQLVRQWPDIANPYLMLGDIYESEGKTNEAVELYNRALETAGMPERAKYMMNKKLEELDPKKTKGIE